MYSLKPALVFLAALAASVSAYEVTAYVGNGCSGADVGTLEGVDALPQVSPCESSSSGRAIHFDQAMAANCEVTLFDDINCTQLNANFLPGPEPAGACLDGLNFNGMRVECT